MRGDAGAGFGDDAEDHLVEAGLLVAAIAVADIELRVGGIAIVTTERGVAAGDEFLYAPGAGPDRAELLRAVVLVLGRRDDDRGVEGAELVDEGRRSGLEANGEMVGVGRLPGGDDLEQAAQQADPLVALEGGHYVGRSHLLAVMEGDAGAQGEAVGEVIGTFVEGAGEVEDRAVPLVARHQFLVEIERDVVG